MSETKFTPGPWRVGAHGPNGCHTVGTERGRMTAMVAHSVNHPEQRSQAIADANLIAASPDMHEALQCAKNVLTLLQDEVSRLGCRADQVTEKIAAALAKANSGSSE